MFSKHSDGLRPMQTHQLFAPAFLTPADRARSEARIRALCANAYLGEDTALCRVLGRYKMFVDTRDIGLSVHLLLDGFWEMWLTEVLAAALKPGMLAIDVGANLGYYTLLMADMVGADGAVYAFEPNAALTRRLRRSAQVNGYEPRLSVREIALGDEDGAFFHLVVPEDDPKNGFITPALGTNPIGPDIIATRRLDSFPDLLDADLVKIDADTAERAIWRGMRGIFDRGRPMTIFLEFNADRYDDPAAFLAEIAAEGFALSRISSSDGALPCTAQDVLTSAPTEDQLLMLVR